MSTAPPLILAVIALLSLSASAQEVAYAYGDLGGRPLESGNITPYNGTDLVTKCALPPSLSNAIVPSHPKKSPSRSHYLVRI